VIPRGFLLALLAAAACSRPAPPLDKETQERAASLAAYEAGFLSSCVAAARAAKTPQGISVSTESAKAACGCLWPDVREAMTLSVRPVTGIDQFNYNVRLRAGMAEHKKFAEDFMRSDEGRKVLERCRALLKY
jgi:hypothetical protein